MGVDPAYIAAWIVPMLAGTGIWIALNGGVNRQGDLPAAVGAGWLIGLFVAAGCARWAAPDDTAHAFARAWPWLVAIGALAWIAALARMRGSAGLLHPYVRERQSRALRLLWWLLLALIVARLLLIGEEASLRPVFPWDAWSAWATKPKTWFLLGHREPYVPMLEWLSDPQAPLRTAAAWRYPELLAWVQLWFASAAGAWNEPLVDLAWCGALAAFALAAYGYWRGMGLPPWIAMALVYALVSLPLIDAHVALAGYADLWLGLTLGLALLAWTRWLMRRERGQWVIAIGIALCLPLLKLEGAVWLAAFAVVVALDLVPRRWRWRAVLAAIGLAVLVGVLLSMLDTGPLHIGPDGIDVVGFGHFALGWHSVGSAMIASLLTLPNWHLLWYVLPLLLIVRWRRFRNERSARLLGLLLLFDFAFLFVLFFFTDAGAWAQDYTSANRLILQLVPSVFVLASVLLRTPAVEASGPGFHTAQARVAPNGPV
jgi:hypothetical protein